MASNGGGAFLSLVSCVPPAFWSLPITLFSLFSPFAFSLSEEHHKEEGDFLGQLPSDSLPI